MKLAAAVLVAAAFALPAASHAANPFSTDVSDLWYNADESGWGVNLIQQGDVAFLTLFTYGADGKPAWFVASGLQATVAAGKVTYTGDLFSFTGTAFNAAWDPSALKGTKVGTATFEMTNGTQGTLTYTVNGARVVKQVVRQVWRLNDPSGRYIGFLGGSCATAITGPEESMTINISLTVASASSLAFSMNTAGLSGVSCGYSGTYSQDGRLGHAEGNVNCTNGKSGTFSLDQLEAGVDGFISQLTTKVASCNFTSHFAAMRRN